MMRKVFNFKNFDKGRHMKSRTILLVVTMILSAAAGVCFGAQDATMGTWKLRGGKSSTAMEPAPGHKVKVTSDGVDSHGNPTHSEWVGKFDGKDYPMTGDPSSTRSFKRVDSHTLDIIDKKDGKGLRNDRVVISPDGKVRTITIRGTDASGKPTTITQISDKE
jgi:hypothetical protein